MKKKEKKFVILLVCSGNACRSPMAEGLLKKKLYLLYRDKIKIHSAGTLGISGSPATPFAIAVAKEKGVDILAHRSKGVTAAMMREADIILVMTGIHKNYLDQLFPDCQSRIVLLTNFALPESEQKNMPITDPIGESLTFYRQVINHINRELERIVPDLKKQIDNKLLCS